MATDVTPIFEAYFTGNLGSDPSNPERRPAPEYGVVASIEEGVIQLELTFRRGEAYCCYEHGCHLELYNNRRWEWLRRELSQRNLPAPPHLELHMTVVIDEGALFFDLFKPDPTRRGWYAFAPVEARRYERSLLEGPVQPANCFTSRAFRPRSPAAHRSRPPAAAT
jgi:hypothetical protein